jgi:hypothetical protein
MRLCLFWLIRGDPGVNLKIPLLQNGKRSRNRNSGFVLYLTLTCYDLTR